MWVWCCCLYFYGSAQLPNPRQHPELPSASGGGSCGCCRPLLVVTRWAGWGRASPAWSCWVQGARQRAAATKAMRLCNACFEACFASFSLSCLSPVAGWARAAARIDPEPRAVLATRRPWRQWVLGMLGCEAPPRCGDCLSPYTLVQGLPARHPSAGGSQAGAAVRSGVQQSLSQLSSEASPVLASPASGWGPLDGACGWGWCQIEDKSSSCIPPPVCEVMGCPEPCSPPNLGPHPTASFLSSSAEGRRLLLSRKVEWLRWEWKGNGSSGAGVTAALAS